ncbi:MAG: phosphotransferase family protein [Novosphingobium sp.]
MTEAAEARGRKDKNSTASGAEASFGAETADGNLLMNRQQPDILRALSAIRRDIGAILLPELTSDRGRTVAASMDSALRHLIVRIGQGDYFLARQVAGARDLLNEAEGGPLDWAAHLAHGAGLEAQADASDGQDREKPFAQLEAAMIKDYDRAEQALPILGSEFEQDQNRFDPALMTDYLHAKGMIAETSSVDRIVPVAGGFSKETLFIEPEGDAGGALVMRRDNPYGPIDSTVVEEYPLLRCLYDNGLPVAEPVLVEPDEEIFGQPFMLSRKVVGRSIPHTTGLLEGNEHAQAGHGLARVLGQLHALDVKAVGLPDFLRPDIGERSAHILAQIDYWEDCWRRYRSDYSPILTRGFRWLRANVPDSPLPPCLVHGDAGPHNLMMQDGVVTAMLDWEFATLGDPMADLVYSRLFIDRIMPWEDFIRTYRDNGGPEPDAAQEAFFKYDRMFRLQLEDLI